MGSNGLDPRAQLDRRQKCPDRPTKARLYPLERAWESADRATERAGFDIVPYACPGCGDYHLTKKVTGSDVAIPARVGVTTGALRKKMAAHDTPIEHPERVEIPNLTPIVPGDHDTRVRALTAFLADKDVVSTPEIIEVTGVSNPRTVKRLMAEVGWLPGRGRGARWSKCEPMSAADLLREIRANEGRTLHEVEPEELVVTEPHVEGKLSALFDVRESPLETVRRVTKEIENLHPLPVVVEPPKPEIKREYQEVAVGLHLRLIGEMPMSEKDYETMLNVLAALKPAIVA